MNMNEWVAGGVGEKEWEGKRAGGANRFKGLRIELQGRSTRRYLLLLLFGRLLEVEEGLI